ncbi:hypothetical protein DRE_07522 [Drechslerella stenobrocha 248]|uniref:Uncharacterized protein n=1 Tax=Drechslerella stenobrocha 248 TaxID=1043628 RepID=W7I449_9PEZI|nr:hypothetical protein DRE_07522 [Drechslerella stenobrocha 248]
MADSTEGDTNHHQPNTQPIPNARINRDPTAGRLGPIVNLPHPVEIDGLPNHTHEPGLDLSYLLGGSNYNAGQSVDTTETPGGSSDAPGETSRPTSPRILPTMPTGPVEVEYDDPSDFSGDSFGDEDDDDDDNDLGYGPHHGHGYGHPGSHPQPQAPAPAPAPALTPAQYEQDARATTELLASRIPPELIPDILDNADCFAHATLAARNHTASVHDNDAIYLTAFVPDFPAFDDDTAGRGGRVDAGGRRGRVRRVVFSLSSHDQGWSSWPGDNGSFRGAWSWFDVELWRDKPAVATSTATTAAATTSGDGGGGGGAEDNKQEKELVGTWLLQRNRHATRTSEDHVITWDWRTDELDDDDDDKWEPKTLRNSGHRDRWHRDGRIANGAFVRELRGGDEIRVIMKARYPGWSCTVDRCKIELFWAV